MKHISEFISISKDLFKTGDILPVDLYFYHPAERAIVFLCRKGEALSAECFEKIQTLPKNTLLVHRSEGGNIHNKTSSQHLEASKTETSASVSFPSSEVLKSSSAQFIEDIIARMGHMPTAQLFDRVIREVKESTHDLVVRHNTQVSRVAVLILLAISKHKKFSDLSKHPGFLPRIAIAGLLHDFALHGMPKSLVENHCLGSDGELTFFEKQSFMSHMAATLELLRENDPHMAPEVLSAIEFHHENFDGSGFHRISGEDIPLLARILRIADDLIACTNHPKNTFGFRGALADIALKDRHLDHPIYDPDIMNALASIED